MQPLDVSPNGRTNTQHIAAVDKHCVFRFGSSWFSLPALSVREVMLAPHLVGVPGGHGVLAGLCHVRNEFVPVLLLNAFLGEDGASRTKDRQLLVISGTAGTWALLIEAMVALESLQTRINPEAKLEDGRYAAVMGTATYRDQVVRVLDPNSLYRLAEESLRNCWKTLVEPSIHSQAATRGDR